MPAKSSPRRDPKLSPAKDPFEAERLQKVLAAAGIGSRRECEELILEGRVEVDGTVVHELGTRVDATCQRIRVDGVTLPRPKREYFIVNKPVGVVCTNRDPSGRTRVVDLVRCDERLFTVGRLDRSSEGLILVTNDGELSNKLTHPRYGVDKTYRVRVAGHPTPQVLARLSRGIHLAEGMARVASAKIKRRHKDSTELEIVLNEGRNREIRRLLARIGHKVVRLTRVAIGPISLAELPVGAHRRLTREEVSRLRQEVDDRRSATRRKSQRKTAGRRPAVEVRREQGDQASERQSEPRQGAVLTYGEPRAPRSSTRAARPAGRPRGAGKAPRKRRR